QVDHAFVSGMLHDIGKLILASQCPDEYQEILQVVESSQDPRLWNVEEKHLGTGHAEVGAYLLGLWGFPDSVIEAVAFHHNPSAYTDSVLGPVAVVHAADMLFRISGEISSEDHLPEGLDIPFLKRIGLDGRLSAWMEACAAVIQGEAVDG
ncbi:MAG: HDOD domain-containing protein, partial [Desulfobacteraceae bacterium]